MEYSRFSLITLTLSKKNCASPIFLLQFKSKWAPLKSYPGSCSCVVNNKSGMQDRPTEEGRGTAGWAWNLKTHRQRSLREAEDGAAPSRRVMFAAAWNETWDDDTKTKNYVAFQGRSAKNSQTCYSLIVKEKEMLKLSILQARSAFWTELMAYFAFYVFFYYV